MTETIIISDCDFDCDCDVPLPFGGDGIQTELRLFRDTRRTDYQNVRRYPFLLVVVVFKLDCYYLEILEERTINT